METLIIEDDIKLADCIASEFKKLSLNVKIFTDGLEAVSHIRVNHPQLILLDNKIPGIEGIDLAKWIASVYNPYIIMITGDQEFKDLYSKRYNRYFDAIYSKPCKLDKIIPHIARAQIKNIRSPRIPSKNELSKANVKEIIKNSVSVINPNLSENEFDFLVEAVMVNKEVDRGQSVYLELMDNCNVKSYFSIHRRLTKIRKKINKALSNTDLIDELTMEYLKRCK